MISQQGAHPTSKEWIALYKIQEDKLWVVSASYFKEFSFRPVQFSVVFMGTFPNSIVGLQYLTLSEVKSYARDVELPTTLLHWMSRVRVDKLSCGSA